MARNKERTIKCQDCGNEVVVNNVKAKWCPDCSYKHKLERSREQAKTRVRTRPKKNLRTSQPAISNHAAFVRINGESRAKGLSYGYGVAMGGR